VIFYKSPDELECMREAGRVTALALRRVADAVGPGVTTLDLDRLAEEVIRDEGCVPSFKGYRGFPASICTSINEEIVHGIPSPKRTLRDGDLVSLDVGAVYQGYHGDAAVTVFVGGRAPSADAERLVATTERALGCAIERLRPGNRISDVGHVVQEIAEREGFGVVREYVGHGVGRALHEDPQVPNYGGAGRGPVIRAGLVVAVEPMLNLGDWRTEVLDDDWTVVTADGSLSAHFEHTIAVTEDGPEVLTALRG
jgi:methionyl aminopeptidase